MAFHVGLSRRRFVRQMLAASGGLVAASCLDLRRVSAADEPTRLALLSDTHIAADPAAVLREVNMADNLRKAWAEVLAQPKLAAAIVHGDLALLKGEPGDYATLTKILLAAEKTAPPLSLLLGNHDDRVAFRKGLKSHADSPLETHHVAILQLPEANWFLLDSLDKVNVAPGALGAPQLEWLSAALDAHPDLPAVISVHHNPQFMPGKDGKIGGLTDTAALFELLAPRKQVKAVVFGHSHNWSLTQHQGIHLINLPPTAYVFAPGKPNGWVAATLGRRGVKLQLHTLAAQHPAQGETHELAWR